MEESGSPQFVLNPGTMLVIGGIMGVLTGAIGKLFQTLMEAKDNQIKGLQTQMEEVQRDRNYWRDQAVAMQRPAERALDIADDAVRRARRY